MIFCVAVALLQPLSSRSLQNSWSIPLQTESYLWRARCLCLLSSALQAVSRDAGCARQRHGAVFAFPHHVSITAHADTVADRKSCRGLHPLPTERLLAPRTDDLQRGHLITHAPCCLGSGSLR